MAGSCLVGCGAFRLRGLDLLVVMFLVFLGCGTCVALCFCFVEMVCGGVIVAGSFRLRALFASGAGRSLEKSSSSCVDDEDVDGGDGGDGDDDDGFCSAFSGRMLLFHLGSFVGALYLGFLVWQIPQVSSWGVLRA